MSPIDDTHHFSEETIQLQRGIEQLNAGDTSVRGELLNIACQRLVHLTRRMKRDFAGVDPQPTGDIFQSVSERLYQALHDTPIKDVRHFYRLAAIQIRRELIALCRQCQPGESDAFGDPVGFHPARIRQWAEFHDTVDSLPDREREVFELTWYHEMNQDEIADLLGVSLTRVRRLWRSARLELHDRIGDDSQLGDDTLSAKPAID